MAAVMITRAQGGWVVETVSWPEAHVHAIATTAERAIEIVSGLLADLTKDERAQALPQEP